MGNISKLPNQPTVETRDESALMKHHRKPAGKASSTQAQLSFIGEFEIWVTRKKVKNVNIRVKPPDGRIEASIPMRMPISQFERFIEDNSEWIRKARQKVLSSPSSRAEDASPEEKFEWRSIVEAFTPLLVERWESTMGVKCEKLVFRDMKSRWGSCQPSTGRICINTRLALYPPECLEYVVVHELCHLKERGHGERFKALMDLYLPDWRSRRRLLR